MKGAGCQSDSKVISGGDPLEKHNCGGVADDWPVIADPPTSFSSVWFKLMIGLKCNKKMASCLVCTR